MSRYGKLHAMRALLAKDPTNERPKGMHPIEYEALKKEGKTE